jgi:hypothetical protein
MGFKADTSFLEKLTMGATATRSVVQFLKKLGFSPIELERYSSSNKIWSTKVKRLRLADLLCVRTGLRIEVRAKSDLQIKMSDSPAKSERRWDSGLRNEDLIALVGCDMGAAVRVRGNPVMFSVKDMRSSVHLSKLGEPKSAGEGAERDRTWPSIVPSQDGKALKITDREIRVEWNKGRTYTYKLQGKIPYISAGAPFIGGASIIAGVVPEIVDPTTLARQKWDPRPDLTSQDSIDRYVAAKALSALGENDVALLEKALAAELEPRTALEMAGALAKLNAARGFEHLEQAIDRSGKDFPDYLRMEAILILSEIEGERAAAVLDRVASREDLHGLELRQAAVWGLGKNGVKAYERLLRYIDDNDDDVALHAIVALVDPGVPQSVVDLLARKLTDSPTTRAFAAASTALRLISSKAVADALVPLARPAGRPWVLATLGLLPRSVLAQVALLDEIAGAIEPICLLSDTENWLSSKAADLQFLMKQCL